MIESIEHTIDIIPNLLRLLIEASLQHPNPSLYAYIFRTYHNFPKDVNPRIPDFNEIRTLMINEFITNIDDLIKLETLLQKLNNQRLPINKPSILSLLYLISPSRNKEFKPLEALHRLHNPSNSLPSLLSSQIQLPKGLLSDEIIIKDLLYVFQGLDGTFLRYNRARNHYELATNRYILGFRSSSQELLTFKLAEIGFLFRRLTIEINDNTGIPNKGLIRTYLLEIFSKEIQRFYGILNSLEAQINITHVFSLKSLSIMISQEYERLKWLNVLWDSAMKSSAIGCQIVNAIYQFYFLTNPAQKAFFLDLLIHINKPLFHYISHWISYGELLDIHQEFFIEDIQDKNQSDTQKINIWTQKFLMIPDKTPNFWGLTTIEKILNCGKTAYFIRKSCGKYDWELVSRVFPLENKGFQGFDPWIDEKLNITNQKVISVLFNEFHIKQEFELLKGYLLMGDGFFIELLLSELKEELRKPCNQIYRHVMMGILEKTIRKTVQNKEIRKKLLERLSIIYVKRSSIIDIGWDLFSMDISFQEPINQIITEGNRTTYSKLLNFMIKIKRFQLEIQEIWKKTLLISRLMRRKGFNKVKSIEKETFKLLKHSEITRNLMSFFLNNFVEFLLIEGIESEWNFFELQELAQCKSVDDIINSHNNFLSRLQKKFMLLPEHQHIINVIMQLFEHIKAFIIINHSVLDDIQDLLIKIQNINTMKSMQDVVLDEESEGILSENHENSKDFSEFEAKLKFPKSIMEIKHEFERTLTSFLLLLEKHQIKTTLAFKLNYNEFLDIKLFENNEKQRNLMKYDELKKLLSPVKREKSYLQKKNSSPDVKKIFMRAFEEEDENEKFMGKNKDNNYINVFE